MQRSRKETSRCALQPRGHGGRGKGRGPLTPSGRVLPLTVITHAVLCCADA